jgi:hypothetical protein
MGIFDSLFKKKIQHLIQENGNCEIYNKNGSILKKFNLSNGLLDGKFESFTIHGEVWATLNFKNGKLHGECTIFSYSRNCIEYFEKFVDGVLVSSQCWKKVDGKDPNSLLGIRYELDSPITDELMLKESGSMIKKIELEGEFSQIAKLRSEGVKFKLLSN